MKYTYYDQKPFSEIDGKWFYGIPVRDEKGYMIEPSERIAIKGKCINKHIPGYTCITEDDRELYFPDIHDTAEEAYECALKKAEYELHSKQETIKQCKKDIDGIQNEIKHLMCNKRVSKQEEK